MARIFDLDVAKLEALIGERFGGKDASVLNNALAAFQAGYNHSLGDVLETFKFVESQGKDGHQVVMNGNEALAYGLIAAGVRFGAAYPITPWSDVMEILRRELPKYGGTFVQCEDEIAAISMANGASFAGRVAVTGSSGPGISLKMESLGWAVMAEVPLVVINVQRGGPSTGLPTQVEQSDLNLACFGSHGDAPRVVLAPADVEDCFYTAIEAVNIARKYNVPVFVLSDQAIATRIEAFTEPNLEKVCQDITPDLTPVADYKPYDLSSPDGVTPRVVPGTPILSGRYPIAGGLEHDEFGHPTGVAEAAHGDDGQAAQEAAGAGGHAADPQSVWPARGQPAAGGLGFDPGPDPGSRGPRPGGGRQRFRPAHQVPQPAAAGIGEHLLRLQRHPRGGNERRRPLRLRPARRPAARPLLRAQDPRHQQDRRPDLESEGNPRTRQGRPRRRACANSNRSPITITITL